MYLVQSLDGDPNDPYKLSLADDMLLHYTDISAAIRPAV